MEDDTGFLFVCLSSKIELATEASGEDGKTVARLCPPLTRPFRTRNLVPSLTLFHHTWIYPFLYILSS